MKGLLLCGSCGGLGVFPDEDSGEFIVCEDCDGSGYLDEEPEVRSRPSGRKREEP